MNSKEIEERVVAMRFDNEQFEKGTKQTINTLGKLKASLDFTGAVKGFKNIASETNIVKKNVDVLSGGVASIKSEFDSLQVVGATALVRLTNAAITAGKNITNALTLEPIKTGFSEYEEKMGSIQTILTNTASKGTTLEEVVKTLDELNTYADKTIYNFAQMTKNIGTFTAAGLDLQTSANSIQGIANLAAASGSTSQQASTAMYQLSQALSAGSLKLQDWNSVVNAGMGGQLFQNALMETAKEYGVAVDDIVKEAGSFRESLSKGWISADILSTTLRKFTRTGAKEYAESMQKNGKYTEEQTKKLEEQALMMENAATEVKTFTQLWDTLKETAQSGWGKTWEIIVGDYEQAKKTFTELNNIISPMIEKVSDSINNLLEGALGSQSKWTQIIDKFQSAGVTMENIKKGLAQSFINRGMADDMEDFDYILNEVYGDWDTLWKSSEFGTNTAAIREGLLRAIKMTEGFSETTMTAAEKIEHFKKVVDKVWAGDYGNQDWNKERQKALEAEGYKYEEIQELVNKTTEAKTGMALADEDISKEMLLSLGLTKEEAEAYHNLSAEVRASIGDENAEITKMIESLKLLDGRQVLFKGIQNSLEAMKTALGAVAQGIKESFPEFGSKNIYDLIVAFEKFTKSLILNEKQISIVKNGVRTFINLLDTAKYVLGTGLRLALAVIRTFLEGLGLDVAGLMEMLAKGTQTLRDFVKQQDMVAVIMEKIGPYIKSFGEWIGGLIDKVKNGENLFAGVGDSIYSTIEKLASKCPPLINNAIMSVVNFFKKNIPTNISAEGITKNVSGMVEGVKGEIAKLSTGEMSVGEVVVDIFSNIKFSDGGITKKIKEKIVPKIKAVFEWLVKHIKTLWTKATDWLSKNFDPGAAIAGVMIYSILKIAKDFIGVLDSFASPLEQFQEMIESIGGMFNALKKRINASTKNLKVQNFLIISTAIFMISMAIRQLATIPIANAVAAAAIIAVLTVAMGGLALLFTSVNKASKAAEEGEEDEEEVENHFGLLGGIAVLMLAMSKVLKELSEIPWPELSHSLLALLTVIGTFIIVAYFTSKLSKGLGEVDLNALGNTFVAFGASMLLLITAVKMAGSLDRATLKKGTTFVIGAGLILKILAATLKGVSGTFAGAAGVGVALIAASIAMMLLVSVVKKTAEISTADAVQALKVMGLMELVMLGFVAITAISRLVGGGSGRSILTLTIAMAFIPLIIKQINTVTPEQVIYGVKVILGVIGLFTLMAALTRLTGNNALKLGPTLLAMSLAMALLVGTIALIGLMKPMTIVKGTAAVAALLVFMSLLVAATRDCQDATRTLTALGVAVALLAGVVVALSFLDAKKAYSAVGIIGVLMLAMAAMLISTKGLVGVKIAPLIIIIGGMLLLIGEVAVLAATISDAMSKDATSTVAGIVAAASLVIAACIGAYFMSKAAAFAKHAKLSSFGIALAAVAAMIAICFVVSKLLGSFGGIDINGIKKVAPGIILAGIITALCVTAAVIIMKQLNGVNVKWKAIGEVGAIVAVLLIVMGAVSLLLAGVTNLPIRTDGSAITKIFMVAILTAFICLMGVFLGKAAMGVTTSTKKLGVLAGEMGLVAAALLVAAVIIGLLDAGLQNVTINGQFLLTLAAVAGLAAVILLCGALLSTFVKTVTITKPQLTKLIEIMAAVSGVMLVAAGIAILIAKFVMPALDNIKNPEGVITGVKALCIIVLALLVVAFVCAATSKLLDMGGGKAGKTIAGMAAMVALFTVIAAIAWGISATIMPALESINSEGMLQKCLALGIVILALGVVTYLLALVSKVADIKGAAVAAGLFAVLAAEIELAIVAFEKFVGPGLPILGAQIAAFGASIAVFAASISSLDKESVNAVGYLIDIMTKLATLEGKMGFLNFFHKDWEKNFKEDLVTLAECCCAFSSAITQNGGIDANAVESAKVVADTYATLADNMQAKGGWKEKLEGVKDFSSFGDDLKSFATAIVAFCVSIKSTEALGIDKQAVLDFCDMARPIINLQKQLYGSDGFKQMILGEKDMSMFGSDIEDFATSMVNIYHKIKTYKNVWKEDFWGEFANAATQIAEIGGHIENSGGLIGNIVGNNDMDKFGDGLDNFAIGMKALYDHCGNVTWDKETWQNMNDCMAILGPMISNYVPKTGGWLDVIKGQTDLEKFGNNLAKFGEGISKFAKSISEDTTSFKTGIAKRCTEDLQAVIEAMPDKSQWKKLKESTDYVTKNDISDSVNTLGGIITTWSKSVSSVNNSIVTNAASSLQILINSLDNASNINFDNLDNFGGSLQSIGADTLQGFIDAFSGSYGRVAAAISSFSSDVDEAYKVNGKYKMILIGKHMVEHIIDGLDSKNDSLKSTINNMCNNIYNTFSDYREHIYNVGAYLTNGLIAGMNSKKDNVIRAAKGLTDFIGPVMQNNLEENSPSKLTYRIGAYVGEGLANGMMSTVGMIQTASDGVSEAATMSLQDALYNAVTNFDDANLHPTITPVVDMSEVNAGFSDISSRLSNYTIGMRGSLPTLGYEMTATDVVDAIGGLSDVLGNQSGDTYNINGITYDDGSNVASAVQQLIYAANVSRRS
jgi:tape measure domain-containing protein